MLIASASVVVLVVAVCLSVRQRELPMDREVMVRLRRFAEEMRREELLPYE